jgi:tetratricopeptide (TPR) repeat protein
MKHKFQSFKLLLIALLLSSSAWSQPEIAPKNAEETYRAAKELFNDGKYGSSLHEFENLREQSKPSGIYDEEIEFYIPVCYLELGNEKGRSELANFVESHPNSPLINSAYFRLGNADFASKRYKQALSEYQKTDRTALSGKELDEYCFKSGYCNLEAGNTDKAKAFFDELKGKSGTYAESSQYYRAHIDYLEGNYDAALTEFQKLEKSTQYSAVIPFYKAQIYFAQGKYQEVIDIGTPLMSKASEKQKTELSKILGVSYYQLKKYNEALPYVDNYLKNSKITPHEYYVAGFCYGKAGQTDKAIANFEKSVSGRDSLSQNAYYQLAGLYIKKGDKQRAMMAFQNASEMKFDPKIREDALFQYAKITYELDYSPFNESVKAFDRYISEYPNSEKNDLAYDYLGKVFMTTRNYKDALASLDKIKVKSPAIKKAYQRVAYNRGIEFYRDLNFTEAVNLLTKSLEYGEYNSELKALSYYWRGDANFRLGKTDEAIADYKKFQSIPGASKLKEYAVSNYNIGYVLFNKEQYSQAVPWFSKYFSSNPDKTNPIYSDAYNRMGDCYFINREFEKAIANYDNAYQAGSSDADYALFQKAFCYGLLQNNQSKIADLEKLQSQFPNSNYIDDALFETGKAYERLKDENKAISNYQAVIDKFPSSPYKPKALLQLGLLAYNRNDFNASINYYKQVAENYPNTPEASAAMTGIRNNYIETNKVNDYISYAKGLGQSASPSTNEQDSLTYLAAEKLYMAKDPRAKTELGNYLENFPSGNFGLNAHFYKAECEYRDNQPEEAIKDYDFVLSQPDNIFTENSLIRASELTYKSGDYAKSLGYYERLETVSNNNNNLLLSLAGELRCNYELKNFTAVSKIGYRIRSMEKIPPELDREATFLSAKAFIELNEPSKALPLWRKLAADTKSLEGAEAKYRICEYYYINKKYKEAENEVMDFIDKNTPHQFWLAKSFILLAHNYEKQNDIFQATHTLKSIIENYSEKNDGITAEAETYLKELEMKANSDNISGETNPQAKESNKQKK